MPTKCTLNTAAMKKLSDFDPTDLDKVKEEVVKYLKKKKVSETVVKVELKSNLVEIYIKGDDPTAVKNAFK